MAHGIRKFNKKLKNGTRYTRWGYDFYDEDDKTKRYRKTDYKTKGQAEEAYKEAIVSMKGGKLVKENKQLAFEQLAEAFLDSHCKAHCSAATQNKYESLNKTHLKPFFGDKKVVKIKVVDINNFITLMRDEKKLAPKSINHALGLLSTIFNYGINNDLITSNPCTKVKKLKLPHSEKNFLNHKQVINLLDVCKVHNSKLYPIIYTAIFTGMRKGEICALTWKDVDFKAKKIFVNKSLYKNKIQEPKTPQSIRKIDMIDSLANALKEHKESSMLSDYVFWAQKGTPLSGDAKLWRNFNSLITKCGLKNITFHDLRHTYASLLIAENIPIKYIQNQMGHSTIKMTMDTYGHLMPDVHDRAVIVLEKIANPAKKEETKTG